MGHTFSGIILFPEAAIDPAKIEDIGRRGDDRTNGIRMPGNGPLRIVNDPK